jgi:DNA polymerase-3 subunit delta
MIIKTFEIEKLKKIKEKIILLYGENEGFKNQIFKEIFAINFKKKIESYDENEILNNFDNFIASILNKSFFDESKLILISRVTDKIIKLVDILQNKNISDTTIVLNTNILEKKSKLRSKFEKEKSLICIAFYKDDNKTLRQIANNFFIKKKISLSQEIINLIVERSSGDRINLSNELEKISLFLINKKKINIEDVIKLTNLAENYSISELADNCLSKNLIKVNKIFNENAFSLDDCILIIRTLLMKSKRLLEIKKTQSTNKNIEEIISNFRPQVFWKEKDIVKNQTNKWNLKDTEKLVYKINEVEMTVKKNYTSALNIVSDFVLSSAK